MGSLDGKVAVVVGASRGIGKGIALELAEAGAEVFLVGRTMTPSDGRTGSLGETLRDITAAGGLAVAAQCDVLDEDAVASLFTWVRADRGRLDVIVNSAFDSSGFRRSIDQPFWASPVSIWHDVVDIGTRSAYVVNALGTPLMLDTGGGLIVNVSGRGAARYRYNVAYGVGKAALDRMTADMALDLRDHGVAVVSLWPATIRTEHMDAMVGRGDALLSTLPDVDAMETPRYVGRAVVALATDPAVMARSGKRFWTAELGRDYGLVDEHGRPHEPPES
jgi:NAD(P)-dependent dehydrogenase (short-subunit alcohol dehydrogenase family)